MAEINIGSYQFQNRGCYAVIAVQEYEPQTAQDEYTNGLIRAAFKALPIPVIESLKSEIADNAIQSITYESNVEIGGEVYGYPEAMDAWEIEVTIPADWSK